MEILFVASIILTLLIVLTGLYESDRIIAILKKRYPQKWRESGYPCRYFKIPKDLNKNWWDRDKITAKLPFLWIKIDWIDEDPEAKKHRKRIAVISPFIFILATLTVISWWIEIRPLFG